MKIPVALTVAGIDPDGGAGVYADIKTFSSLGVYGIACPTALTAQNTKFFKTYIVPPKGFFDLQFDVLLNDIKPLALKTGMIPKPWMIDIIVKYILKFNLNNLIVDTVMISKGGGRLIPDNVIERMKKKLFPIALLITPNMSEAEFLSGIKIDDEKSMVNACKKISAKTGARNILLKGGDLKHALLTDVLYLNGDIMFFKHKRIKTKNTHGTGCTLSSAITAFLSKGKNIYEAVSMGCDYVYWAIKKSLTLGEGNGPLNHFWFFERE